MYCYSALALLGFAVTAIAQGSIGGSQASCSPQQNFVYSGCYDNAQNGRHAGLDWMLSTTTTNPKYYPGYVSGSMSVDLCLRACRGHGLKWAVSINLSSIHPLWLLFDIMSHEEDQDMFQLCRQH